mgnify:CR=1 FL=1
MIDGKDTTLRRQDLREGGLIFSEDPAERIQGVHGKQAQDRHRSRTSPPIRWSECEGHKGVVASQTGHTNTEVFPLL